MRTCECFLSNPSLGSFDILVLVVSLTSGEVGQCSNLRILGHLQINAHESLLQVSH